MVEVTAFGELLIDFASKSMDEDGYPTMAAHAGGAPANFLAAVKNFGHESALIGKVGDDAFGRMLVRTLKNRGIETRGIVKDPKVFTTLAFVTFNEQGDRSFSFARKPGADTCLSFSEVDLTLIEEAKAFYFGLLPLTDEPSRSAVKAAVAYAKACGKLIFCDPNLRLSLWKDLKEARKMMTWCISQADILKLSSEEAAFLWGLLPEAAAQTLIRDFGVKLAMVTMGADGCIIANRGAHVRIPCPKVRTVDTTGAGDIFGGSAMSRILEIGKAPEELTAEELTQIGTFATYSASLSTEHAGGIASIQSRNTILEKMKR